jgi:MFS family permease
LPGGILAERWGGKYLLSVGILSTAFFTIISPLAAKAGSGWLIAVRVLMGLGEVKEKMSRSLLKKVVLRVQHFLQLILFSPSGSLCRSEVFGALSSFQA